MTISSFRRHYLDEFLSTTPFHGEVLDVGGKKEGKKGAFRPPLEKCKSWRYVNVDQASAPDFLASADALPLPDASLDCVLLSEVLEHLRHPEKALAEACRVLRPGGRIVLSVPFLFPVHGDPYDFQRWTPEKFRAELGSAGFGAVVIRPMGGLFAVLIDVFEGFCQEHYSSGRPLPFLFRLSRKVLRSLLMPSLLRRDRDLPFQQSVTGGYFVTAEKA